MFTDKVTFLFSQNRMHVHNHETSSVAMHWPEILDADNL